MALVNPLAGDISLIDIYGNFLSRPKEIRQMFIDIESVAKKIKDGEAAGMKKPQLTEFWMETVALKDLYKKATNLPFEAPSDLSRIERLNVNRLFSDLKGFCWSRNFGWVGHAETMSRNEVKPFEASPSLYDGIITNKTTSSTGISTSTVRGIDFTGYGCEGSLPEALFSFEKCEFLKLSFNLIAGSLPLSVRTLRSVLVIELSGNLLTGRLDGSSFRCLVNLTRLDLSFNNFSGAIPDIFDNLPDLQYINLAGNKLDGELPASIATMSQLTFLNLSANRLCGSIAEGFGTNLLKLRQLNLSQNRFTKGINSFNSCANLEILQLNDNSFRGRIDGTIAQLQKLDILYMQNNKLSGLLPSQLCHLTQIRRINLSNNNFRGLIPDNIGMLVNLESFLLSDNAFIGPVPLSISRLVNLRDFHVFKEYPAEMTQLPIAFHRYSFQRMFEFAPSLGIDSMNWDYEQVYGRPRNPADDDSVTIFSGKL